MEFLNAIPGASLLGYLIPFLIVLTIVVFFHELGHFLVARWNGVRVEVFSLGFGPELAGFNDKHGTRWRLSAIPLGGYVKFFGDASAASTTDHEKVAGMTADERSVSFVHKKVWQRAAIVAAGPIANFILAIVIFTVSFVLIGRVVSEPLVSDIQKDSPAAIAGFLPGDIVRRIDGVEIASFTDIPPIVSTNPGRELVFSVERDGALIDLPVTPKLEKRKDRFGNEQEIGFLGIVNDSKAANARIIKLGPVEALQQGVGQTWFIATTTIGYLRDIVTGRQSAKQLGGPIRIAKISGDVATLGVAALINLAALLSVSIGLLNLFPIPLLDGGHLVFYAFEALRGRPLSENVQEIGARIGFAMVMTLMALAFWNDITQIVFRMG